MWTVFEIAINFFQGFLMILFMNRCLPESKVSAWWFDVLFEAIICGFYSLYLFIPLPVSLDNVIFIIPLLYAVITKRGSWPQRIIWTLTLGAIFNIATIGVSSLYEAIFDTTFDQLMEYGEVRLGFVITTNVAITTLVYFIPRIFVKSKAPDFSSSSFFIFIITLVLQIVIAELLFIYQIKNGVNDTYFLIVDICMIILVIMTVLLYEIISQYVFKRHQAEMALQVMELSQKHNTDIHMIYNEMLATQHDMRHRINAAESLLKQSSNVPEESIHELLDVSSEIQNQFITGNAMVDAILTAKKAVMDESGISFRYQPYPLQKLPIREADFCVLISNILDNAIEAIGRMGRKADQKTEIHLSLARSWDMFYIRCENPMDPNTIHIRDSRYISSKENARIHGFGTQYIKHVAENAGGQCHFMPSKDHFTVLIVLPDQEG